ncbi:MEIOTIC F-BOX protein MOF-like [Phragmites australis]|uniref:MEIOTIC F-BOX protein MOF-like n=1 Tax=Phragmites australis TaxID=29695 RepID=UPI002D79DAF1|nr:MEIOTIC F-BOX protein MOF-like [Phragmites australis]
MPPRKRGRKDEGAATAAPPEVGRDHISALPDDALQHILSSLPAQDAVRTCALARRWRHLWKFTKDLHMTTPDSIEEIREFVDHLLLLRAGLPIDTFELGAGDGLSEDDIPLVNLWIRHAVAYKVQVLQLEIFGRWTWLKLKNLHLVFASQHLTRLEFANIRFNDSFFNFSSCLALQDLRIRMCELMHAKRISSYIHAPNLASLWLDEAFERAAVLERMPSLVEAVVTIHVFCSNSCSRTTSGSCDDLDCQGCHDIEEDDTCVLLQGLSIAKNLALVALSNTFIFRRDLKWCPTFSNLRTSLLNEYWCVPADFSALECILEHSPVLEKLTLQLFCKGPKSKVEIKGIPDPIERSAAISEHLRIVEVKCEVVDETVLNVLKFLNKFNINKLRLHYSHSLYFCNLL